MKKLFALIAVLAPALAHAGPVTVKGSDTMVILAQRWAEELMKKHPELKIQVGGGGSGVGIAALINGTTDIATASRPMKPAERDKAKDKYGQPVTEIAVAKDGVTFYVNESNPVSVLTMEQLKGIYMGDITNWKEVGGADAAIVLYSRENSSGTYVFVKDDLLGGADYATSAQTLPGTAAVVNAVSKEKNGIGYGGAAYAKGVKEIKIKTTGGEAIAPDEKNIKSGKYPMSRDLYFYLAQKPTGDVKAFVDFVLSSAGQAIVTQVGYFPLK
jgi:phosphate transport system substrate-binding protein